MNKEQNVKKAFLWNMIGSSVYSGASFLYLIVVTRICGTSLAGFFSLSYATAQLLLAIGRYGIRTYQATDLTQKYAFSEYKASRIITCSAMMLCGLIYSVFSFKGEYIIVSVFIILMKMIDAVEDVYHGNLQQNFHVELMGKMLALRNFYSAAFFTLCLSISKNLSLTCILTSLSSLALCIISNSYFTHKALGNSDDKSAPLRSSHVFQLLKLCTPLFIGTFLSLLLYNIPKYAMQAVMSDEYQTYYSILFMPSFVITLMCEFVFKPTITTIAELWFDKNIRKFIQYIIRIIATIFVFGVVIVVGGHYVGRWLLEVIYGVDLSPYKLHFIILLIAGGLSAEVYIIYNILIGIRWGNCLLPVYSAVAVITIIPAKLMVERFGVMGAALNYLLSCSLLFVLFLSILIYVVLKEKKKGLSDSKLSV